MVETASDSRRRVVVFGEAMLRLGSADGRRLEEPGDLTCHVAGSEINVGYALARLGVAVTWLGAVPDGPVGRRVELELRAAGVDLSHLVRIPGARIGLFFAEVGTGARPGRVYYDRERSAFTQLSALDLAPIAGAWGVVVSGITPALGGRSADNVSAVTRAADEHGARLCVDVNYRSLLWTPEAAREALGELLARASIAVCSERDAATVFGVTGSDAEHVRAFAADWAPQAELVVITRGDRGCTFLAGGEVVHQPAMATELVDPFGVGDAFVAGLVWQLIAGAEPREAVRAASVVAAIKATIRGDLARVSPAEVQRAVAGVAESLLR